MLTDVLIIGSGIAGLSTALRLAQEKPETHIIVLSKSTFNDSNSQLAQGGIAVSSKKRSDQQSHIADTLEAGNYLGDPAVVGTIIHDAAGIINQLLKLGVDLDRNAKGEIDRIKEGGHSNHRIIHSRDTTGAAIMSALLTEVQRQPSIQLLANHFTIDLVIENGRCTGALVLDKVHRSKLQIASQLTIMATGGIGMVYGRTTNSSVSSGDGIAMAARAGAIISDMEFIQFHPTALFEPGKQRAFLISEAVRGFGAELVNQQGIRFMQNYDARLELAPRDIVSRAIATEMNLSGTSHVFLKCTHFQPGDFRLHFPAIYDYCRKAGLNPEVDLLPVSPVEHYLCGGIETDLNGKTSIPGLYACGECTRTGLHGANRLASNSLLEALVMSSRIARHIVPQKFLSRGSGNCRKVIPASSNSVDPELIRQYKEQLQFIMQREVGIIRTNYGLAMALDKINEIETAFISILPVNSADEDTLELRNIIHVAKLIVTQCLERKQNIGGHFNLNLVTPDLIND